MEIEWRILTPPSSSSLENLRFIRVQTNLDPLTATARQLREVLAIPIVVPEGEEWVVEELAWLLGKGIELYYSGEEEEEKAVREIIDALCG